MKLGDVVWVVKNREDDTVRFAWYGKVYATEGDAINAMTSLTSPWKWCAIPVRLLPLSDNEAKKEPRDA